MLDNKINMFLDNFHVMTDNNYWCRWQLLLINMVSMKTIKVIYHFTLTTLDIKHGFNENNKRYLPFYISHNITKSYI